MGSDSGYAFKKEPTQLGLWQEREGKKLKMIPRHLVAMWRCQTSYFLKDNVHTLSMIFKTALNDTFPGLLNLLNRISQQPTMLCRELTGR